MADEKTVTGGPAFPPSHPGEVLREDILPALGMTRSAFARHLKLSRNTLHEILRERRPVTLDVALKLGKALGNSARFWLSLQMNHDLWHAERASRVDVEPIDRDHAA